MKIAKEKGIDALEEDLKMRNAIGLPVGVDRKALNQFTENVKFNTVDTMVILMAGTDRDFKRRTGTGTWLYGADRDRLCSGEGS